MMIFIVPQTLTLNDSFLLFFFFKEKQQKTYNELGEMKGIFYQNLVIIVFIFTVAVLVAHFSMYSTMYSSMYSSMYSKTPVSDLIGQ